MREMFAGDVWCARIQRVLASGVLCMFLVLYFNDIVLPSPLVFHGALVYRIITPHSQHHTHNTTLIAPHSQHHTHSTTHTSTQICLVLVM